MEYTFNPEKIKQLAEGKAILGHTQKYKDLETLRAILKQAFPNDYFVTDGKSEYYFATINNRWDGSNLKQKEKPIIPLHDFVSPTKEEKQTIDTIDVRLKELGKITFELKQGFNVYDTYKATTTAKEEQPKAEWKVGEWAWSFKRQTLFLIEEINGSEVKGNTQGDSFPIIWTDTRYITKPAEEEIETYLIGLAKQRYPVGTKLKSPVGNYITNDIGFAYVRGMLIDQLNNKMGYVVWESEYGWAEVLPQAKHNVNIIQNHSKYEIRVTGLTQAEAEKYAETIKNALNSANIL